MTATPPPLAYTVRTPGDLVALAPVVLGFVPSESVVMLTFGAPRSFHARVDLPPVSSPVEAVREVVECLREPAVRHGVPRVAFVLFTDHPAAATRTGGRLVAAFASAGIDVIDAVHADAGRWYPLRRGRRAGAAGVPYDLATHPFTAQAVLDGLVTLSSRTELAGLLRSSPERVRALAGALDARRAADPAPWVEATCRRLARERRVPDDAVAARLLRAVAGDPHARDAAWAALDRDSAPAHADLWADLVRRAPDPVLPTAAGVLAAVAWAAGRGALAWCAVDRARELDPDHPLAARVADLLAAAVPPPPAGEEVAASARPA